MASMLKAVSASALLATLATTANAQATVNNQFRITGNSGVSAQQMFLATAEKVIVVDKTQGNGNRDLNINGHPVWGTEYDVTTDQYRPMDVVSNTFCAGGNVLGNGSWLNVGGNQPVGPGGLTENSWVYDDGDGGKSIRMFTPCDDEECEWRELSEMTTRRWYPTLETLEDGSIIIIGGCDYGGYVNDANQNNPTFEYYPSRGGPIGLNILTSTLPANLFAHTFLLPSGNLFINANLGNEIFDYKNNIEHPLGETPHAVRTYPGSAATAMMPLTPQNNYTATIWFCGGTDLQPDQWQTNWNIAAYPADDTCISITPDESTDWVDEDDLPEGRSMGNMIVLPDGRFVILNGIATGTAGYGNTSWAVGQSFGDNPLYTPMYFDPERPSGSRFYRDGMGRSTVPRLYHSSALLLPDGSIMSAGSAPSADYIGPNTPGYKWQTEYRVDRFYPDYFNNTRPTPSGLPESISYGGQYFDVSLPVEDTSVLDNTKVVLVRPGFSTHAMNMGQRYVQLEHSITWAAGNATIHVSQLPPNPAILAPGPALIFVVVNGTPSIGQMVMVGNGEIGDQPTRAASTLPENSGWTPAGAPAAAATTPAAASSRAAPTGSVARSSVRLATVSGAAADAAVSTGTSSALTLQLSLATLLASILVVAISI